MDTIPLHYCIHYRIILVLLSVWSARSSLLLLLDTRLSSSYFFSYFPWQKMWWKETNLSPAFSSIKKFLRNWLSSSIYLLLNVSYNSLLEMQRILKISSFYSRCYLKSDEEMHRGEGEGEVKSARYRLRLRGAERGGTSTPSRIDRTVDASPFWRNTCWADSPPRPSLDGHFANDRGMCRGISVINYGRAMDELWPLSSSFLVSRIEYSGRSESWSSKGELRGWEISYFLERKGITRVFY